MCQCNNQNAQPIVGTAVFPEQKPSVEITKNAKGEFQWSVKVYDANVFDAANKALEIAEEVQKQIAAKLSGK